MAYLSTPFNGRSILELANAIVKGEYELMPSKVSYSTDISRCVSSMLVADMNNRPSINRVIHFLDRNRSATISADVSRTIASNIFLNDKDFHEKVNGSGETDGPMINHHPVNELSRIADKDCKPVISQSKLDVKCHEDQKTPSVDIQRAVYTIRILDNKERKSDTVDVQRPKSYSLDDTKVQYFLRRDQAKLQRLQNTGEYLTSTNEINSSCQLDKLRRRVNIWIKLPSHGSMELTFEEASSLDIESVINGEQSTPRPSTAANVDSRLSAATFTDHRPSSRMPIKQTQPLEYSERRSTVTSKDNSSDYQVNSWNKRHNAGVTHSTASEYLFLTTAHSCSATFSKSNDGQTSTNPKPSFATKGT